MLATVEQIQAAVDKSDVSVKVAILNALDIRYDSVRDYQISRENITAFLEKTKRWQLDNTNWKGLRPWSIVNVAQRLDASKIWVGIEYETGFNRRSEYQRVISHVWDNYELVAVDREGCGNYQSEITFSPVELEDFTADTYHVNRLMNWLAEQGINSAWNEIDEEDIEEWQVGIHCNISTPSYRALDADSTYRVRDVLNYSLSMLDDHELHALFSRVPYGGFGSRSAEGNQWLEGKLFCTTDDVEQFNNYKTVIERLAGLIETLSADPPEQTWRDIKGTWSHERYIIENFYEILQGVDVDPIFVWSDKCSNNDYG